MYCTAYLQEPSINSLFLFGIGLLYHNFCNSKFHPFFPDEAYDLDFYYEQAEDYPVDLYYLMDLSKYVLITCFHES